MLNPLRQFPATIWLPPQFKKLNVFSNKSLPQLILERIDQHKKVSSTSFKASTLNLSNLLKELQLNPSAKAALLSVLGLAGIAFTIYSANFLSQAIMSSFQHPQQHPCQPCKPATCPEPQTCPPVKICPEVLECNPCPVPLEKNCPALSCPETKACPEGIEIPAEGVTFIYNGRRIHLNKKQFFYTSRTSAVLASALILAFLLRQQKPEAKKIKEILLSYEKEIYLQQAQNLKNFILKDLKSKDGSFKIYTMPSADPLKNLKETVCEILKSADAKSVKYVVPSKESDLVTLQKDVLIFSNKHSYFAIISELTDIVTILDVSHDQEAHRAWIMEKFGVRPPGRLPNLSYDFNDLFKEVDSLMRHVNLGLNCDRIISKIKQKSKAIKLILAEHFESIPFCLELLAKDIFNPTFHFLKSQIASFECQIKKSENRAAMFTLGKIYEIAKNSKMAIKWYKRADFPLAWLRLSFLNEDLKQELVAKVVEFAKTATKREKGILLDELHDKLQIKGLSKEFKELLQKLQRKLDSPEKEKSSEVNEEMPSCPQDCLVQLQKISFQQDLEKADNLIDQIAATAKENERTSLLAVIASQLKEPEYPPEYHKLVESLKAESEDVGAKVEFIDSLLFWKQVEPQLKLKKKAQPQPK